MAGRPLDTLIPYLRRVVPGGAAGGLTDAQLLERFVRARDEAAFEVLVWRHGAMVHNVCLRVLRRTHDAEDAFQATFLVFARKASSVGRRASVGSWLYKVAYRIALRARTATLRQPAGPLPDTTAPAPFDSLFCRELRSALDEEVGRLPEKYRTAFELCELEGRTAEAVGRALGCPRATVATRLARARVLLRRRLARRGFEPAMSSVSPPSAALPAALVDSAVRAVRFGTAEKAVAAGVVSARAATLAQGALTTMSVTKLILVTAFVLTLSLFGAVVLHQARGVEPPQTGRPVAPPLATKEPAVVLRWRFEKDQPFEQELTTTTSQDMTIQDNKVNQTQAQTFYFRWTPFREARGDWLLQEKILGVKMDLDIGGNKIQFDSSKGDDKAGPLSEFYKGLVGSELWVTLDMDAKVSKVEGGEELAKKLSADNPSIAEHVRQVLSDDALRQMAEMGFAALPTEPVKPGDSWTRKSTTNMVAGRIQTTTKYTYLGREGKLDKIAVEGTGKLLEPVKDEKLPFKITKTKLRIDEVGTLLFDRDKGRVASLELTQTLAGKLTLIIGGQETEAELAQVQKVVLKTTDAKSAKVVWIEDTREIERLRVENERLRVENERLRRQLKAVEDALRGPAKAKE